jgi:hypothetical protein
VKHRCSCLALLNYPEIAPCVSYRQFITEAARAGCRNAAVALLATFWYVDALRDGGNQQVAADGLDQS